jgi:integrase
MVRAFARSLAGRPVTEARSEDIDRWITAKPLAEGTQHIYLSVLHTFFAWAVLTGERPGDNPVRIVRARRTRERAASPPRPADRACGRCAESSSELRHLGGQGAALCDRCYQRARRAARRAEGQPGGAPVPAQQRALYEELVGSGLGPRTVSMYLRTTRAAQGWFDGQGWRLATATPSQVAAYAATVPQSWSSLKLLRSALGHYWRMAQHPRPPTAAVRVPPKPAMECRALDEDDARLLAKAARARGDEKGLAVLLGLYQAMRREEIAALPWSAFREDGWLDVVGKGSKRRSIPVHPVVSAAVGRMERADPTWVFPGRHGGHVVPPTVWAWVRLVADEAGLAAVRTHELRHTALATQQDATGDLRTVQAFAGHSKPETTAGYTRATRRRLLAGVAAVSYE